MSNHCMVIKTDNLNKWNENIDPQDIAIEGVDTLESGREKAEKWSTEDTEHFYCVAMCFDLGRPEHEGEPHEYHLLDTAYFRGQEMVPREMFDDVAAQIGELEQVETIFTDWLDFLLNTYLMWNEEQVEAGMDIEKMEAIATYFSTAHKLRFANDVMLYQMLDDYVKLLGLNHIGDIRLNDNSEATWLTDRSLWESRLNDIFELALGYGHTRDEAGNMLRDVMVNVHKAYNKKMSVTPVTMGFYDTKTLVLRFIHFFPDLQDENGIYEVQVPLDTIKTKKIKSYIKDFYAFSKEDADLGYRVLKEDHRPILSVKVNLNATNEDELAFEEWHIAE